ncbi:hypothetical protein TNCV_5100271 [Trichonephila clavipes]|uniref:Uncharacterized protein n=1 Tax=Trichonephila clavipes TaxID=2585209 RepID=A0A8X6S540_TRICX|nr:hypothetical protein TNCV_5100271 [Trichonephila clavipes]
MRGHGGLVVKVSDRAWRIMSSSRVLPKTRRVGEQYTLNLSRAQKSSRWCSVVVRRGEVPAQVTSSSLEQNCEVRRQKPSCS